MALTTADHKETTMTRNAAALAIVPSPPADHTRDTIDSIYAEKKADHPDDFPKFKDVRDVIALFEELPSPF